MCYDKCKLFKKDDRCPLCRVTIVLYSGNKDPPRRCWSKTTSISLATSKQRAVISFTVTKAGLLVTHVEDASESIRRGDIVVRINNIRVRTREHGMAMLAAAHECNMDVKCDLLRYAALQCLDM